MPQQVSLAVVHASQPKDVQYCAHLNEAVSAACYQHSAIRSKHSNLHKHNMQVSVTKGTRPSFGCTVCQHSARYGSRAQPFRSSQRRSTLKRY